MLVICSFSISGCSSVKHDASKVIVVRHEGKFFGKKHVSKMGNQNDYDAVGQNVSDNSDSDYNENKNSNHYSKNFSEDLSETTKGPTRVFKGGFLLATPINSEEFVWPLFGKVIQHYKENLGQSNVQNSYTNIHSDGIRIAAPLNAEVVASGDGLVVYVGMSDVYGHMLIIKHANDYFTAYGHLNNIAVTSGAKVKKGQLIGYVGKTGEVESSQLCFFMRKGKKIIDPELEQ